jgi:ABC-2 type transport system ATP-binding protein
VFFLDEPFEGIDAVTSKVIRDVLTGLVGRRATVFLTSHILDVVERLCTHVAIIHRGRIVAADSLDGLRAGIAGEDGARRRTLEEVFLSLVQPDAADRKGLSWIR